MSEPTFESVINTDGAVAFVIRNWMPGGFCTALRDALTLQAPWIQGMTFGQPIPRTMFFLGDEGIPVYSYNNRKFNVVSWDVPDTNLYSTIRRLRDYIRDDPTVAGQIGMQLYYDSCLLNNYRDGADSIMMHSDKEALGPKNAVAALSLGATRTFIFKSKTKAANGRYPTIKIPINNGDLMIMAGECQNLWTHGINKEPGAGQRISLTFRTIKN